MKVQLATVNFQQACIFSCIIHKQNCCLTFQKYVVPFPALTALNMSGDLQIHGAESLKSSLTRLFWTFPACYETQRSITVLTRVCHMNPATPSHPKYQRWRLQILHALSFCCFPKKCTHPREP